MEADERYLITTAGELAAVYAPPSERALLKQIDHLDEHCAAFIAASPFVLMATCGAGGADCTPRGDAPGFAEVVDAKTLLLPDRPGNNRLDSLRNIVENPAVGLLFMVPGVNEVLRVNGRARITRDPALRERFAVRERPPATVLIVSVEAAFIQCAKSLVRSELWNPARQIPRSLLPSLGTILAAHTGGRVDAAAYDDQAEVTIQKTLY